MELRKQSVQSKRMRFIVFTGGKEKRKQKMSERHIRETDRPVDWKSEYLGDGVYASYDGFGIWLTAEDGVEATDAIYFEPQILKSLQRFLAHIEEMSKESALDHD